MTPLDQNMYIRQYNINLDKSFNQYSFDLRSSRWVVASLDENRYINLDKNKSFNQGSRDIRSYRFSDESYDPWNYVNSRSVALFNAVKANDVNVIKNYLTIYEDGVNDLDKFKRNAIQVAISSVKLRPEACNALIKFGINLDNRDFDGNTVLAKLVHCFEIYKQFPYHFELFRCLVEGGADLNVKIHFPLEKNTNIRERIKSNPELETIVQEVNAKRANLVYAAIGGDFRITKLVCEILDLSPESN